MAATVVLVHGAWHGAWCWELVIPLLDAAGVPSIAIDLPGHGDSNEPLSDLAGDARALRSVLADLDSAVVCGHSYGGAVVSEGVDDHPGVRHLVFLAALPLAPGESCVNAAQGDVSPDEGRTDLGTAFITHDDGTITLDPELVVPVLYADCPPDVATSAAARLGPQSWAELQSAGTRAAWEHIPSTYVVCRDDRAVAPALQRAFARRCTRMIEWPTGHSPFLSRPELVADLLAELAA